MAANSRAQRESLIGLALPVPAQLPTPDTTINVVDRQWLCWLFIGFLVVIRLLDVAMSDAAVASVSLSDASRA